MQGPRNRVLRGGCFNYPAVNARSADRSRDAPGFQSGNLGLRAARGITE